LSREVTIEQHITVELMCAYWRSHRLLQAIDRAERKAWPTGTEDQWGDHHMQTIKAAGLKKTRYGIGTAFDQHAAQAKFGQSSEYNGRRNISICRR
jgi:hypothetical protein